MYLFARSIQPTLAEWSSEKNWVITRVREEIVTQARGVATGEELQAKHDPQVQAALKAVQHRSP